jgi:uncharacterized membrane protein YGL010W
MPAATELLSQYAQYHRDQRNIRSHFIGIPMVVLAVGVLLARPTFSLGSLVLSPAWMVFAWVATWYITRGSVLLGLICSASVAALLALAHHMAHGSTVSWLSWALGAFLTGRLLQFIGHFYEGQKMNHAHDLRSLLVGPLFITAQVLFYLGWNKPLLADIERRAGPVVLRDMARIV